MEDKLFTKLLVPSGVRYRGVPLYVGVLTSFEVLCCCKLLVTQLLLLTFYTTEAYRTNVDENLHDSFCIVRGYCTVC